MKQVINNLLRGALPAVNATLDGNLSLEGHWQLECMRAVNPMVPTPV